MIIKLNKQKDYELIDSGDGFKLERYGSFIMSRPDKEAIWPKKMEEKKWKEADLFFIRDGRKTKWIIKKNVPKNWDISFGGFKFSIKPTSFKHTGLFPEQLSNWEWMEKIITDYKLLINNRNQKPKVLNLFAYTGGATLACASAGAEVVHVDASKSAVVWGRENALASNLEDKPIRWLIEDVLAFVKREVKRGNKYDAIVMDPPAFGHGPKDELWKIEDDFIVLINLCKELLSPNPLFVLINGYTAGYSPIVYENNLSYLMEGFGGKIESGELAIEESFGKRLLPCGIFARWSKGN